MTSEMQGKQWVDIGKFMGGCLGAFVGTSICNITLMDIFCKKFNLRVRTLSFYHLIGANYAICSASSFFLNQNTIKSDSVISGILRGLFLSSGLSAILSITGLIASMVECAEKDKQ
jgi:hypothetical protein